MAIKLIPSASTHTYQMGAESGYKYEIRTSLDPEWGWGATVIMSTYGMKCENSAVEALRLDAEHFLRQLKDNS